MNNFRAKIRYICTIPQQNHPHHPNKTDLTKNFYNKNRETKERPFESLSSYLEFVEKEAKTNNKTTTKVWHKNTFLFVSASN